MTGASRGIGRATALALAGCGADLAICSRRPEGLEDTAAGIRNRGRRALSALADVSNPEEVGRFAELVRSELGPVDILVNNAGGFLVKPLLETSLEEWDRVLDVNLRGVFLCIKAFAPSMVSRRRGAIMNIASLTGLKPYWNQGAYCASKHAVVGLTEVLAWELREYGIRVAAICPGGVNTRLVADQRPDIDASEYMSPEQVAKLVLFELSLDPAVAIDVLSLRRFASSP